LADACSQSVIRNVQVQNVSHDGFTFQNNCVDIYWSDSRSDSNDGDGIVLDGVQGFYTRAVTAYNNNRAWVVGGGGGAAQCKNMFFSQCVGDTSSSYNWLIQGLISGMFTDCWGSSNKDTGVNTFATGFYISGVEADVNTLRFTGGGALACNSHGYQVANGADNVTFNNVIAGSDSAAGRGNGKSGSGSGINITGGGEVTVVGGSALGNATKGVAGAADGAVRNVLGHTTEVIGVTSKTTDANGEAPIAHGLDATPVYAEANIFADTSYEVTVVSVDATNINIRVRNTTSNADIASTSVPGIRYHARA